MRRFLNMRTLTLLGAAFAGLLTIFMLTRYLSLRESEMSASLREQLAREGFTTVAVADREITPGTTIIPQDLKNAPWPKKAVPPGVFDDLKGVEGRVAARKILVGEPLMEGHLAPVGAGTGLAAIIPKGKRAVAVRVNEIIGVAGFIKPGDLVDVIVTMEPDKETGVITKTVLQQVKVLAVGQEISREGGKPKRVSAVTLLVDPDNAEKLALASRSDIQLAMRNTLDKLTVSTAGSTPVRLIGVTRPKPQPVVAAAPKPKDEVALPPPVTVEIIRGSTRGLERF